MVSDQEQVGTITVVLDGLRWELRRGGGRGGRGGRGEQASAGGGLGDSEEKTWGQIYSRAAVMV